MRSQHEQLHVYSFTFNTKIIKNNIFRTVLSKMHIAWVGDRQSWVARLINLEVKEYNESRH